VTLLQTAVAVFFILVSRDVMTLLLDLSRRRSKLASARTSFPKFVVGSPSPAALLAPPAAGARLGGRGVLSYDGGAMPRALSCLLALVTSIFSASAAAQSEAQAALPLDRFNPSAAGDRFFATASPYALGHLQLHGLALFEYGHDPLVLRNGDEEVGAVVEHQLFMHLDATFALLYRLAFNVDLPIALAQGGDDPAGFVSPSGSELGDLRLGVRASLFGEHDDFFQLGAGAYFWAPTASADPGSYVGNGSLRGKPYLAMGGHALRFIWGLEIGADFRERQEILGVKQGTMLELNLANGVLLGASKEIQLSLELAGAITPGDVRDITTNFEALGGGKWRFLGDFVVGGAVGTGLIFSGIGTPDLRAVLSVAYTPAGWSAANPQ
jgi:hypothetical protein